MTSKDQHSTTTKTHYHPIFVNDTINLREVFNRIRARKLWILIFTTVPVLLAVTYISQTQPTFKLQASFRPPLEGQFAAINESDLLEIRAKEAFDRFRMNLASRQVRMDLFNRPEIFNNFINGNPSLTREQLFGRFDNALQVIPHTPTKDESAISDITQIVFTHQNPSYGAKVVNELLEISNKASIIEVQSEYKELKEQRIKKLNNQISKALQREKERRLLEIEKLEEEHRLILANLQDKLKAARIKEKFLKQRRAAELKESISIAKTLNIEEPTTIGQYAKDASTLNGVTIKTELRTSEEPLYLRGTKLLEAELNALQARQHDDLTSPEVINLLSEVELHKNNREIEILETRENDRAYILDRIEPQLEALDHLNSIDIQFETINFARIDQKAFIPHSPVKPQSTLILGGALLSGLILGILGSLFLPRIEKKQII